MTQSTIITISDKSKAITELHLSMSDLSNKAREISEKQKAITDQFLQQMKELSDMHRDILTKMVAAEETIEAIMKANV